MSLAPYPDWCLRTRSLTMQAGHIQPSICARKRDDVIGNSHDIIRQEDEEAIFERWAAEDAHIAQRSDVGLEQEEWSPGLVNRTKNTGEMRRNDSAKALPSMGFRCAALLSF